MCTCSQPRFWPGREPILPDIRRHTRPGRHVGWHALGRGSDSRAHARANAPNVAQPLGRAGRSGPAHLPHIWRRGTARRVDKAAKWPCPRAAGRKRRAQCASAAAARRALARRRRRSAEPCRPGRSQRRRVRRACAIEQAAECRDAPRRGIEPTGAAAGGAGGQSLRTVAALALCREFTAFGAAS